LVRARGAGARLAGGAGDAAVALANDRVASFLNAAFLSVGSCKLPAPANQGLNDVNEAVAIDRRRAAA
jgi:hypothetical protein